MRIQQNGKMNQANEPKKESGCSGCLGLLVLVGVMVVWFTPWGVYQRAKFEGTESAYESFLRNHASSDHADEARGLLADLKFDRLGQRPSGPSLRIFHQQWVGTRAAERAVEQLRQRSAEEWTLLADSEDLDALKRFEVEYAGTAEATLAASRRAELIPRLEWRTLQSSSSLAELEDFIRRHDSHVLAGSARGRIEALCRDAAWVRSQDVLRLYKRHLDLVPQSSARAEFSKRIIDLEVDEIMSGEHGRLPPATPLAIRGGSVAEVQIENGTRHALVVRYSGIRSYRFDFKPGETLDLKIAPGSYKVAASVDAGSVRPYAGTEQLQGGAYGVKFYISSR